MRAWVACEEARFPLQMVIATRTFQAIDRRSGYRCSVLNSWKPHETCGSSPFLAHEAFHRVTPHELASSSESFAVMALRTRAAVARSSGGMEA